MPKVQETVRLEVNEDERHTKQLILTGSADEPAVKLENEVRVHDICIQQRRHVRVDWYQMW